MKANLLAVVLAFCCIGVGSAAGQATITVSQAQKTLAKLETEHRIRQRALGLVSEMALFDDTGMQGRVFVEGKRIDIVVKEDGGREGVLQVGLEGRQAIDLNDGMDFDQTVQLAREIRELETLIGRLKTEQQAKPYTKKKE